MNPTEFICGLMRRNTDALGFIPRPTIATRFVPRGQYVIQRNRFRKPIGYLIHGPVHKDGSLHIHQACIELDRRNRGFGQKAVRTVLERATRSHARRVLVRCAADLDAIAFWLTCGFLPTAIAPGGARRRRSIVHFALHLDGTLSQSAVSGVIVTPPTARPYGRLEFRLGGHGDTLSGFLAAAAGVR